MNIIIIHFNISGNDGVTLEYTHWKEILERMGHKVTFLAGKLDRGGVLMPELHYQWPNVMRLHDRVVYDKGKYRQIEARIFDLAGTIEGKLRHFFNGVRKVDLIIVPNVFSLPMHFPLTIALTRVLEELQIPTIARHHDFWWERSRYRKSHLFPFFQRWFPPKLSVLKHVVINSFAKEELKRRTGIEAEVIGDTFDFTNSKMSKVDGYSRHFRSDFGISATDKVFLQATRIVPRKRIELSIEFMKKLNLPNVVLVISGHAGDEGMEYLKRIKILLKSSKIRYVLNEDRVNAKRRLIQLANGDGSERKRVYTMWDCYRNSDFVLYPTKTEGFGNQFVEAVYFKKPVIMTLYPVFKADIEPLGFEVISMSQKINRDVLNQTKKLVDNPQLAERMVNNNFELGKKYFSYEWVEKKLSAIVKEMKI